MNLPLYLTIDKKVPIEGLKELTKEQTQQIAVVVSEMDTSAKELVYMLVYCHYKERHPTSEKRPYGTRQVKKGIKIHFGRLPLRLKHMIFTYVTMYDQEREREQRNKRPDLEMDDG